MLLNFYQRTVSLLRKPCTIATSSCPWGAALLGSGLCSLCRRGRVAVGASGCRWQKPMYTTNAAEMFNCSLSCGAVILAVTPGRFFFSKITPSLICIFACCYWNLQGLHYLLFPPPPPPQKNTSEHHGQQVSSYFSLILSKLRSNQNVVIKFIDYHTT